MTRTLATVGVTVLLLASFVSVRAADTAPASEPASAPSAGRPAEEKLGPAEQLAIAKSLAKSLVRVEFTLQVDKGESPSELILQERPWECEGFVLAPTKVLCDDVTIHPRFIKSIAVRCGSQLVKARPVLWGKTRGCSFLELEEPLRDAQPLVFDANLKGPYLAVSYRPVSAEWVVGVEPLNLSACLAEDGRTYFTCPPNVVVADKTGRPVGLLTDRQMPADDTWKGSPLDWPVVSAAEREKALQDLENRATAGLLRVALSFRSPKKGVGRAARAPEEDGEGDSTERNVLGLLVDKQKMLVLAKLSPKVTARLDKISVYPPAAPGQPAPPPVPAKFDCTLAEYGAFLVALEKPLEGAVRLSAQSPLSRRLHVLYSADVSLRGENRVSYFNHTRVETFQYGYRRQVYLPSSERGSAFLFDSDGELLILPISRREKVVERRFGTSDPPGKASCYLKATLDDIANKKDLARHVEADNVPLPEQDENRLAWLGVELQPLNRELARANNVSDLTHDGATGALISYVYEGSPAAQEGLRMGDILLRLNIPDQPMPLEVQIPPERVYPWDDWWKNWDRLPEDNFDSMPTPWQPAENMLTRALTDLGFGKKYSVEFVRDGKVMSKDFTTVPDPRHYESSLRYKSEATGITVRDMTFESRRYFRRSADDPGVIISTLTRGSKGSVAGLKPYEIITHVNDKPVRNVKEFESALQGQDEVRLSVLRLSEGRTVKIVLGGAATRDASPAGGPVLSPMRPAAAPAPAE